MSQELVGEVRVTGVINDEEFAATGEVGGNPQTGHFRARLDYEHVPVDWSPVMYTDVKAGLLFYKEEGEGKNFLSAAGGTFKAAGMIDFGNGDLLRNHAVIELLDENTFRAAYVMHGTARTGTLATLECFEETMIPMGEHGVAAVAIAKWRTETGDDVDAMFSTRYDFPQGGSLEGPQLRRIDATPSYEPRANVEDALHQGGTFSCEYAATVQDLPVVREKERALAVG